MDDVGCVKDDVYNNLEIYKKNILPRSYTEEEKIFVPKNPCNSVVISCFLDSPYILFLVNFYLFINCNIDNINYSNNINKITKIYSGSFGYNVAYRIDR